MLNPVEHPSVEDQLHDGENSRVYRCRWPGVPGSVVVKVPSTDHPTPHQVSRWRSEYAVLQSLDGVDGVVRVHALEEPRGIPTLVLEDVRGIAARDLVDELGLRDWLMVAIDVAESLGRIHDAGVLHGNITPRNIVVGRDGAGFVVRLIDFAVACRLSAAPGPLVMQGTLRYLSPEQTGRMNRPIDFRADFYALGATLYELLTGRPVFDAEDPLELVRCHVAQMPVPAHEVDARVPRRVSAILGKLLAKAAELRYQSAFGLVHDLRSCVAQLDRDGKIGEGPVGALDVARTLQVSQKLYGRGADVASLFSAFDRVSAEGTELLLVSGYAGVGKSYLVAQLHRPISAGRGCFVTGKSEQYRRDAPYAPFAQAFKQLVHQLLLEERQRVEEWRTPILAALGAHAQRLVDLVPELEALIGKQPPAPAGTPAEMDGRLLAATQAFLGVLASRERPIVIFLDDIQWMDLASMGLLRKLLTSTRTQRVLFIGAYRDHEIDDAHPLHLVFDAVRDARVAMQTIALKPLASHHIRDLLVDTLRCDAVSAAPLAELLVDKTHGNPFFVNQLILLLHQEGMLRFSSAAGRWDWELDRIRRAGLTDNVVDLMVAKLRKLGAGTQRLLQFAACLGTQFDPDVLATTRNQTTEEVIADLQDALAEGLIVPKEDRYEAGDPGSRASFRFLHDRVQQAAYATIPDEDRPAVHAQIGRLLRAELQHARPGAQVFDVLEHLRLGVDLLTEPTERLEVAALALEGGRRAKGSLAYHAARAFLSFGMQLLPEGSWHAHYPLTYALQFEHAQCGYLAGDFAGALRGVEVVLDHAQTRIDQAEVYRVLAVLHETSGRFQEAFAAGLAGLRVFGVEIDLDPASLTPLIAQTVGHLRERRIEDLLDAPPLSDPEDQAIAQMLASTPAFYAGPIAFQALHTNAALFSIRRGHSEFTPVAYLRFAVVLAERGEHALANELGRLGLELSERQGNAGRRRTATYVFGSFLSFRHEHFRAAAAHLATALEGYLHIGDQLMATYTAQHLITFRLLSGDDLEACHGEVRRRYETAKEAQVPEAAAMMRTLDRFCANLIGLTRHDATFDEEGVFDEGEFEQYLLTQRSPSVRNFHYFYKSLARYIAGNYADAKAAFAIGAPMKEAMHSLGYYEEHAFLEPLILTALGRSESAQAWAEALPVIRSCLSHLEALARHAPMNYAHKCLLVEAEIARVEGRVPDAERLYDEAIASATEAGFVNNAAIASECAGRWYQARGHRIRATGYLTTAARYFTQWGAYAKARQLKARFPDLVLAETTAVQGQANVDMTTVTRALHAIASEIRLDRLLESLTKILIANAGAQRGFVVLDPTAEPKHRGEDGLEDVADAIVRQVARTGKEVVLADASSDPVLSGDATVRSAGVKSVLGLPAVHQGKLIGVVYLENNLVEGCFTAERLDVLHILVSQMAVSVENARLYAGLEATVQARTQEALQKDLALTAAVQSLFLPRKAASRSGDAELRGHYWPASVCSGDWWWYDERPGGFRVLVGDVTGHGAASAMLTASMASFYRVFSGTNHGIALEEIFVALHEALCSLSDGSMAMTMSGVSLDGDQLRWCSAGALPILVTHLDGSVDVLNARSTPLGDATSAFELGVRECTLRPGDRVAIFTDGLTEIEVRPDRCLGLRGLMRLLTRTHCLPIDEAVQSIVAELQSVAGADPLADDVTLVLLDYAPPPSASPGA